MICLYFARLQVGRPRRGLWRWLCGPLSEGFKFWFTTMALQRWVFRIPGTCCFLCFHESVVLVLVSGFQELIWHRRWNWMIPWMDVFRHQLFNGLPIKTQVWYWIYSMWGVYLRKKKNRRTKFQYQTNTNSQFSHVQYTYSIQRSKDPSCHIDVATTHSATRRGFKMFQVECPRFNAQVTNWWVPQWTSMSMY